MDKSETINVSNYSHSINIVERKNIIITGVKKIESFDNEEFLLETALGYLIIKGEGLEVIKLDTIQGNVSIKGFIKSLVYIDENNQNKKESSFFRKLFK
ncbi:MAG: sporulation protein YabP [Tenericutes bacterium]|jgi:sporulation protein YabP|nr:sporulation protein YabP [Mycoplasmatota bacterium]